MAQTNPEDIVRKRYPDANIEHREALTQLGQMNPIQQDHWVVFAAKELGAQPIGDGPTATAAWAAAASKIVD